MLAFVPPVRYSSLEDNADQLESQMLTKSRQPKTSKARTIAIPGLNGVRIVEINGEKKLELRNSLGMPRELFGRLINVSVRLIADVESMNKKGAKLQRNYIEVKRLCDNLSEVVDPACLGDWLKDPNDAFDGFKPIEVIERGEIDRLWEMFYRLRSGMPG